MKDAQFTMTLEAPRLSPEMIARWQEEVTRNFLRMKHLGEMVMNPKEPEVGPTPREVIYRKNKSRLYRYASKRTVRHAAAVRPQPRHQPALHLRPHAQGLVHRVHDEQGFDMYLVDWGVFGPEDNGLTSRTW